MSIWATFATIGENEDDGSADGSVRDFRSGYSNAFIDETDSSGSLYACLIPWWCVPGWDAEKDDGMLDDGSVGKWVRISAHRSDKEASVCLNEAAALELYHRLGEWLMLPKVDPKNQNKETDE